MSSSRLLKRLLIGAGVGFLALLLFGFVVGAIGSELFGTDRLLEEPEVHLPASAVFPTDERENSVRGGNLGFTGFAITNTMLSSWLATVVLILILVIGASRMKLVPGRFQALVELTIEGLLSFVEGVAGREMARRFFPVIATIFLFVLLNAWMALLPFYFSLGFDSSPDANAAFVKEADDGEEVELHGVVASFSSTALRLEDDTPFVINDRTKIEEVLSVGEKVRVKAIKTKNGLIAEEIEERETPRVDLLRSAGTDVNMPLALAIVSFIFIEFWGLRRLGFSYLGKFIRLRGLIQGPRYLFNGMIDAFVGILEGISELIRVVSFTFRLFGNMLAGELLILVSAFLVPFVFSVPFYGLEILVGIIQAMIFAGLTLTFATVAVARHEEEA